MLTSTKSVRRRGDAVREIEAPALSFRSQHVSRSSQIGLVVTGDPKSRSGRRDRRWLDRSPARRSATARPAGGAQSGERRVCAKISTCSNALAASMARSVFEAGIKAGAGTRRLRGRRSPCPSRQPGSTAALEDVFSQVNADERRHCRRPRAIDGGVEEEPAQDGGGAAPTSSAPGCRRARPFGKARRRHRRVCGGPKRAVPTTPSRWKILSQEARRYVQVSTSKRRPLVCWPVDLLEPPR